jgi:diketogulonate reductase-like aldo/keto reductase
MEQLVDAGLCKHIGVSNFTREHLDQILPHCRIKPAMNQVELHPYLPQNELVEYCRSQGILCTAYSPLGSAKEPSLIKDPVVERIAKQHNVSPAQILISWAVQRGTVCIPKSVHAERIRQNSQLVKLTGAEMNELSSDIKTRHRFCSPALFWGQPLFEDEKQQ